MNLNKLNQVLVSAFLLLLILATGTWIFQQFHASAVKDQSNIRALREKFYWECFAREYKKDNSGGTEKNERVSAFCSGEADKYTETL